MKLFKYFLSVGIALTLVACGSSNSDGGKDGVIVPETTTVSGDLSDCYKVVQRDYIPSEDLSKIITIEVERTDAPLPFDANEYEIASYSESRTDGKGMAHVGFGIEMLDANGNVIDKVSPNASGISGSYSSDDQVELGRLKPGNKGTIRFEMPFDETTAKKVVKFRLTSAYELTGTPASEYVESDDNFSSSIDDFSKEYEKAKREYQQEYDKAKREYQQQYDKAKREYQQEYDKAKREMGL